VHGKTVTLAWTGKGHLFVDNVDQGELDGSFIHPTDGELHTYRLQIDSSRCNFVYANL
jgi:hypothetical protein